MPVIAPMTKNETARPDRVERGRTRGRRRKPGRVWAIPEYVAGHGPEAATSGKEEHTPIAMISGRSRSDSPAGTTVGV